MWYLLPVAGLVIAGIVALSSEEEKEARTNWSNKYENTKEEVERLRRDIERELESKKQLHDFYVLNELYYSSFRFADSAYKLLSDSKTSLNSIKKMLNATNSKRYELKKELDGSLSRDVKKEKIGELRNLTEFRNGLEVDLNAVNFQKEELAKELKRLNGQTRDLKLAMASRCGKKGREWYENLQDRISSRQT